MKLISMLGAVVVVTGSLTACGDDVDPPGTPGTGGSGASSGRGGSSGTSATGGSSGSSGSGTGGTAGTSGAGGSSGTDAGAGTGGTAGDAGTDGPITYWGDGVKGTPLSADADDRLWGVAFHNNAIYAVGYVDSAGNKRMVVAKYNTQAELDTTWGTDAGRSYFDATPYPGSPDDPATTMVNDPDPSVEEARDVVIQSDGKIVVVGRAEDPTVTEPTRTTPHDLVFFRLTATGQLDETFGTQGKTYVNLGTTPDDQVWGLDIDGNNRIYAFASGQTSDTARTDQDRYVVRLTAGGVLDNDFGNGGKATFDVPQTSLTGTAPVTLKLNDNVRHGIVLPGGAVLSAGYTQVAGRNQIVLAKFTSAGILDTSFSVDGIARLAPFPLGMAEAYGVTLQTDGKLVTTGYGRVDLESTTRDDVDLVSFRVTASGDFDSTWGVSGSFVYDIVTEEERGRYTFALPDDRIMMVGAGRATIANKDAMLLLLDKNGVPVANFDDETKHKLYDFGGESDEFYAAASNGTFIAAVGYATGTPLTNGNATLVVLPVGP